jgi:signal transduction histidine kinase
MKSLPIRIRLSLWYFAMFASAAALLSFASMFMLRRSVDAQEYHELQERAEDVQEVLQHEDPNQSPDALQREFAAIYEFKDDGKYLQVRDQDGNWIFRSRRLIQQNPELLPPDRLPPQGVQADFHQGTRYVRILSYPIVAQGRHYAVQTGLARNKSMALVVAFRNGLLLLTPAVILLAGLAGHWMSRKALKPVAALAARAQMINDRNLGLRLPVPNLNQMLERIDKAFASVRAFTGNASHELRTPISLLRAEIDIALMRPRDPDEYRATLLRLNEEAVRMTNLVENLLSLARADGGAETIGMAPFELSSLLQSAKRAWTGSMQRAMLDFHVEIPAVPIQLLGDPGAVQRLLSILLENATKYTPPGGSVTVCARCADSQAVISVRDTGVGISAEDLPRIFDRFYRGTQACDPLPRGSGLGLALAKWIADRHGTKLTVESCPGQGSCFSFSLQTVVPTPHEIAALQPHLDPAPLSSSAPSH